MKSEFLEWLVCPDCAGRFELVSYAADGIEVVEGLLTCNCGRVFPVVDTIPRILDDAFTLFPEVMERHRDHLPSSLRAEMFEIRHVDPTVRRTRDSFGYQWTQFSKMVVDFRENFLSYIYPLTESFFPGKLGLDVGCGFGRHILNAAVFGAEMVGVDVSAAIDATRHNTKHLAHVHLVQADIHRLPFRPGTFDFAYSIGVLHHLPDPEAGFQSVVPLVKPGGAVFIWVYSTSRRVANFVLEAVRRVTTRIPRRLQWGVSLAAAAVDWGCFILPYRLASAVPGVGRVLRTLPLPRLRVYAKYPFQVCWADWFDRLAAPVRFYYDAEAVHGWLARANLHRQRISATGLFGWRGYGERSLSVEGHGVDDRMIGADAHRTTSQT